MLNCAPSLRVHSLQAATKQILLSILYLPNHLTNSTEANNKMGARILPLIILLVVVAIIAVVGYIAYSIAQDVSKTTREKMEKKHLVFSKDGMKIGVKEVDFEKEHDRTQRCVYLTARTSYFIGLITDQLTSSVLVNIWNHTSFPAYKSRFWNMAGPAEDTSVEQRKP